MFAVNRPVKETQVERQLKLTDSPWAATPDGRRSLMSTSVLLSFIFNFIIYTALLQIKIDIRLYHFTGSVRQQRTQESTSFTARHTAAKYNQSNQSN